MILSFMLMAYKTHPPDRPLTWEGVVRLTCQIGLSYHVRASEVQALADMTVRDLFP